MIPKIPLEYASVAFAVMWGGWMFWSGDTHGFADFVLWMITGAIAGYCWYLSLRWWVRRKAARGGIDRSAP